MRNPVDTTPQTVVHSEMNKPLTIGISARALFDLEHENAIFEHEGLEAYRAYQRENEALILSPGTGFHLVAALLGLNTYRPDDDPLVEVVVMSRNSPDLAIRIFQSISHHRLAIKRAAFSSGESLSAYFEPFGIDLYLSRSELDVAAAIDAGLAAAVLYDPPPGFAPPADEIRIAFDGDAVLFSEESEAIYKIKGLEAFIEHERSNAEVPLSEGPFANLLSMLGFIQATPASFRPRLKIALVTARSNETAERVIRTFRLWGMHVDLAFFLGGKPKHFVLDAFQPHIFFDDQDAHAGPASHSTPTGRVPYRLDSKLRG